jgi:hypothetical protein
MGKADDIITLINSIYLELGAFLNIEDNFKVIAEFIQVLK